MTILRPARPLRAACFAALALVCLAALGFGFAIQSWPEPSRRIVEFIGYVLFVVLALETADSCRRGGVSRRADERFSREHPRNSFGTLPDFFGWRERESRHESSQK